LLFVVPVAIFLLYFLKLKRQPAVTSSTLLWRKTIEDMQVNSLWQRLRKSLLLLLQLLMVLLLIAALLRPGCQGDSEAGRRLVLLIDRSASMSATDVGAGKTRLQEAQRQAGELVRGMKPGDVAMVMAFTNDSQTVQSFTSDKKRLLAAIDGITPSNRPTDATLAFSSAAGQAKPPPYVEPDGPGDVPPPQRMADVYVFSDGGFPPVAGVSTGNLNPRYVPIGKDDAFNLAITAFVCEPPEGDDDTQEAFARVENFSTRDVTAHLRLELNGVIRDAAEVTLPAGKSHGVTFDVSDVTRGELKLTLSPEDDLAIDNTAYALVGPRTPARVLLVTGGAPQLATALSTERAQRVANVEVMDAAAFNKMQTAPADGEDKQRGALAAREYDLVIFDNVPITDAGQMPLTNTLSLGYAPPLPGWRQSAETVTLPQIISSDPRHPLTRGIDFSSITVAGARPITPPPGGQSLITADLGTMLAIASRASFEDAALAFEIAGVDAEGESYINTDWPRLPSFPLFALSCLEYFGGFTDAGVLQSAQPGEPIRFNFRDETKNAVIETPTGAEKKVARGDKNYFELDQTDTETPGVYRAYRPGQEDNIISRDVVNLFSADESKLRPREEIYSAYETVSATHVQPRRHEWWRYLVLAAAALLVLEWWVYHRRGAL
jgi:hypothetical protein